jgi:hypothetical protein
LQQAEVKIVDQRRGLENIGVSFSADVGCGYLAQVRVDQRHQALKGRGVYLLPPGKKQSDLSLAETKALSLSWGI